MPIEIDNKPVSPHIESLVHQYKAAKMVYKNLEPIFMAAMESMVKVNDQLWDKCKQEGVDFNKLMIND